MTFVDKCQGTSRAQWTWR